MARLRKLLRWPAFGALALILLFTSQDVVRLNVAQEASAPYIYDVIGWHARNILSKWTHRISRSLPWNTLTREEKLQKVDEYFELGRKIGELQSEIDRTVAESGEDASLKVQARSRELEEIRDRRRRLRDDVEESLEAAISAVVADEGFASWWKFVFPPVDIRLTAPPKLLVTSPRDRIGRTHDVLLRSSIALEAREQVEDSLFEDANLAGLVINIGGVATYPASIPNDRPLAWAMQIAAHEWLHHYFFFRPLGQNMFNNSDMRTLNETVADIVGREIGDRALEILDLRPQKEMADGPAGAGEELAETGDDFDFDEEMRKTRSRVDELLGQGMIEEAEAYMEERRKLFVANGFYIRKLNQAYFGFHGTYADSPSSISPIADQLMQMRELIPDLGDFIGAVTSVSSYDEFLDKLKQLQTRDGNP